MSGILTTGLSSSPRATSFCHMCRYQPVNVSANAWLWGAEVIYMSMVQTSSFPSHLALHIEEQWLSPAPLLSNKRPRQDSLLFKSLKYAWISSVDRPWSKDLVPSDHWQMQSHICSVFSFSQSQRSLLIKEKSITSAGHDYNEDLRASSEVLNGLNYCTNRKTSLKSVFLKESW